MKSRLFRLSIVAVLFTLFGLYSVDTFLSLSQKAPKQKLSFSFMDTDERIITSAEFLGHHPVLVICLDPECSACSEEILEIAKHQALIKKVSLILIAESDQVTAIRFFKELPSTLQNHAACIVDNARLAQQYFGKHILPSTYLYSKNGGLIKFWKGEVSWSGLYPVLTKIDNSPGL